MRSPRPPVAALGDPAAGLGLRSSAGIRAAGALPNCGDADALRLPLCTLPAPLLAGPCDRAAGIGSAARRGGCRMSRPDAAVADSEPVISRVGCALLLPVSSAAGRSDCGSCAARDGSGGLPRPLGASCGVAPCCDASRLVPASAKARSVPGAWRWPGDFTTRSLSSGSSSSSTSSISSRPRRPSASAAGEGVGGVAPPPAPNAGVRKCGSGRLYADAWARGVAGSDRGVFAPTRGVRVMIG
jgi:hypothetical protein